MSSLWMVIAGLLSAAMGYFVKVGSADYSIVELIFYRSVFGLILFSAILWRRNQSFKTEAVKANLLRGLTGLMSLGLYYASIKHLTLSLGMTLFYTAPLFVALITARTLQFKLGLTLLLPVLCGFAGVALLLQPALDDGSFVNMLLGILSGVLGAFAYMNVKSLGKLGEPEARVVFYYSLICLIGTGGFLLLSPAPMGALSLKGVGTLLGLGATANLAQLAMTLAYSRGNTFLTSSLSFCAVVFSFGFGVVFFDETISATAVCATVLIILSGVFSFRLTQSAMAKRLT